MQSLHGDIFTIPNRRPSLVVYRVLTKQSGQLTQDFHTKYAVPSETLSTETISMPTCLCFKKKKTQL